MAEEEASLLAQKASDAERENARLRLSNIKTEEEKVWWGWHGILFFDEIGYNGAKCCHPKIFKMWKLLLNINLRDYLITGKGKSVYVG